MTPSPHRLTILYALVLLPILTVLLAGCVTTAPDPVFQNLDATAASTGAQPETTAGMATEDQPVAPSSTEQSPAPESPRGADVSDVLEVGDAVIVTVTGITTDIVPQHEERIKDDGTINLYLVGAVKAGGLTTGELQRELQQKYEQYFKNPVVTVNTAPRYYYVGGEVKRPGAQPYLGKTTVTKAIQAAGDFTDFAKKTNLQVIRTDGTKLKVNFKKAIREPSLDPPIYPGDKIHVPRRVIW